MLTTFGATNTGRNLFKLLVTDPPVGTVQLRLDMHDCNYIVTQDKDATVMSSSRQRAHWAFMLILSDCFHPWIIFFFLISATKAPFAVQRHVIRWSSSCCSSLFLFKTQRFTHYLSLWCTVCFSVLTHNWLWWKISSSRPVKSTQTAAFVLLSNNLELT